MITPEIIQENIDKLTIELSSVREAHDKLLSDHQARTAQVQQSITQYVVRSHQITGAVAQLKQLLNGDAPPPQEKTS